MPVEIMGKSGKIPGKVEGHAKPNVPRPVVNQIKYQEEYK